MLNHMTENSEKYVGQNEKSCELILLAAYCLLPTFAL